MSNLQNIDTDESVSPVEQLDPEYDELTDMLADYFLLQESWEDLQDLDPEGTFRLRHVDFGRSELHSYRTRGILEDASVDMGAVKTWQFTDRGQLTLRQLQEDTFDAIPELSFQGFQTFERHYDTIVELPRNTMEVWEAEGFDLNDGEVAALSRHGFIEAETERVGRANTWTTTRRTRWLTAFMGYSE